MATDLKAKAPKRSADPDNIKAPRSATDPSRPASVLKAPKASALASKLRTSSTASGDAGRKSQPLPARELSAPAPRSAAAKCLPKPGLREGATVRKAAPPKPLSSKSIAKTAEQPQAVHQASTREASPRIKKSVHLVEDEAADSPDALPELVLPTVEVVKPANQLQLAEKQLNEEFARSLNAARPGPPQVTVWFNLEERCFKPETQLEHVMVHYSTPGVLLQKDSEEGQRELSLQAQDAAASLKGEEQAGPAATRRLRNQFNFSERGAQTPHLAPREQEVQVQPPATAEASGDCTSSEIFDAYMSDLQQQQQQQQEDEVPQLKAVRKCVDAESAAQQQLVASDDPLCSARLQKALLLMERMGSQNNLLGIALDFKYWEDEADDIRPDEGTLLPLWKFSTYLAHQKQVTALAWSQTHTDLFVVAFGSFDFSRPVSGLVAGFSLKNPLHPEFSFQTKSGAMALHLHLQHASLLAVGCYDGSVAVFDVRAKRQLLHSSSSAAGGHVQPVWGVVWRPAEPGAPSAFYSLSSDGRLLLWTMAATELTCQEALQLDPMPSAGSLLDEEPSRAILAAGCSIEFHPVQDFIFLVGTQEGAIYKFSTAYRSEHLLKYEGHDMAVYAVRWNLVHTSTFLSSSADWTIKLWHADNAAAVMCFSLGSSVGDISWSPFSATVLAAVTEDGFIRVFDLHKDAAEPLCEQRVVTKAALTRVAFNPLYPLLLAGDDRGHLVTLKLSPNLRKYEKAQAPAAGATAEVAKLEEVLQVARKTATAVAKATEAHSQI